MFPKKNRLTKKEIVELKEGKLKVIQGKYFGLVYLRKENEKKVGLILSGKISKKSVERNKIKRLLFRALEGSLFNRSGWFLFLAKKASIEGSLESFQKEVENFEKEMA